MSDDEVDLELLELLRNHLHGKLAIHEEPETGVLEGAEYVYDHGVDVAIDMRCTKAAAETIYAQMQQTHYSTATWSDHELHPQAKNEHTVAFIFTMDLLNFSFWSDLPDDERFATEYRGKQWTGYWSLVAALQRALDDGVCPSFLLGSILSRRVAWILISQCKGIPITDPHFWQNQEECNLETLRHVFRSCTDEEMPMLRERLACLQESGRVLYEVTPPSILTH